MKHTPPQSACACPNNHYRNVSITIPIVKTSEKVCKKSNITFYGHTIGGMSGNADRSLTYQIQLASNRTNQLYKVRLEEEKRQYGNIVKRPILSDSSAALQLNQTIGSLNVYQNGTLYMEAPSLVEEPSIIEVPQSIAWSANFATDLPYHFLTTNRTILSTNETNSNYTIRYFTYGSRNTKLYNRDGVVVKDLSSSWLSYIGESIISFTSNDGNTIKTYHFRNLNNRLDYLNTRNFTNSSITSRIALSKNRVYNVIPCAYLNTALALPPPNGPRMQILDDSDNVIANITADVSGGNTERFDSALLIYSVSGDYITNVSMRTRDLSDNNANNIAIRGINTFSDGSVILCGDFNTQQIVFFNAADVSMGQLTLPVRKIPGTSNNRDIFMAAFDTSGALRYYNYIRSSSPFSGQNEFAGTLTVDTADNVYMVGTYFNQAGGPSTQTLMQFFAKNKSSTVPSSNILYDTSGYNFLGIPNNSCNFSSPTLFVTKYNYNGDFQWFATMASHPNDISGDLPYQIKSTSNGVIVSMLYSGSIGGSSGNLSIYQGKTSAQRGISGEIFCSAPLSNTTLFNNVIVKYNFNGTGAWAKSISGDIFFVSQLLSYHPVNLIVDSSNNIYNICSLQGSPHFPNARLLNLEPGGNFTPVGSTISPSPGSNPYITSLDNAGNLRWNGIINTTGPGVGTYCFNAVTTTKNEIVLLCNVFSDTLLSIYNASGSLINTQVITLPTQGTAYLLVYKISTDGATIKYILSQSTSTTRIRVNNGISIDSNDNIYITGELFNNSLVADQTMNLVNQSGNTVVTITRRGSVSQYEYFTVKIPASFIQE